MLFATMISQLHHESAEPDRDIISAALHGQLVELARILTSSLNQAF